MAELKTVPGGQSIILEGIDGSGKTTQLVKLAEYLTAQGWRVHTSRNLGGTPIGEALRQIMLGPQDRPGLTNLYLSMAIQVALAEELAKQRDRGAVILIDRSPISMVAYESHGSRVDRDLSWQLCDEALKLYKPDLILHFVCPLEQALARHKQESTHAGYFETKPKSFFERVNQGLNEGAKRYKAVDIDASGTIDQVFVGLLAEVNKLLRV